MYILYIYILDRQPIKLASHQTLKELYMYMFFLTYFNNRALYVVDTNLMFVCNPTFCEVQPWAVNYLCQIMRRSFFFSLNTIYWFEFVFYIVHDKSYFFVCSQKLEKM